MLTIEPGHPGPLSDKTLSEQSEAAKQYPRAARRAGQGSDLYDGFGTRSSTGAADVWQFEAQWGYYTDAETGLILCTHRFYDPSNGRWLTRDPIGYGGGVNLYGYVGNNPGNGVDPSGYAPKGGLGKGISPGGGLKSGALKAIFPPERPPFAYNENAPGLFGVNKFGNGGFNFGSGVGKGTAGFGIGGGALALYGNYQYLTGADPGFGQNVTTIGAAMLQGTGSAGLVYGTGSLGLGTSIGGAAIGGLGVGGAIIVTGVAGWRIGTEIADAPWGPGGQTIADFWADQISGAFIRPPEDTPTRNIPCR